MLVQVSLSNKALATEKLLGGGSESASSGQQKGVD